MKQILTIDGENFSDLEGFYIEIDRVLTKDIDYQTGHNIHAFIDLLRGGHGMHDYEEPIKLIWNDFAKSKQALGQEWVDIFVEYIKEMPHIEFEIID